MSKTIYCAFLKRRANGQDFQFFPGALGKYIFENISKEAWAQWQAKQTMLINEKKLNMTHTEDRKLLEQQMLHFLFKGQDIDIQGSPPPSK